MRWVFILFILPLLTFSQIWPKEYYTFKRCTPRGLTESYDHGYLINVSLRSDPGGYNPFWVWLIKTDVNGEVLWEKKIGDGNRAIVFWNIYQCQDGGFILPGAIASDDEEADVVFMKLNACGEKEWCRIFLDSGSNNVHDFSINIFPLENEEGYIALVSQWGSNFVPGSYKGIWLFRLANDGSLIWIKNVFDEVHPEAWNETAEEMLLSKFLTNEGKEKVIITAWPIYNDYGFEYGWDKTMICAADVEGKELWWAIHHQDESYLSKPEFSVEDKYGNIYTVGRDEQYDDPLANYYPALFKTDKDGNKIFQEFIIDSTFKANAFCINILNDTILDIGGVWEYDDEVDYAAIARTDTNGNLIMEKKVIQSDFGFSHSIKTIDNKELFIKYENWGTSTNSSVFLYKFNYNLDYDTLYTQPFEYDYKCENLPIIWDTIGVNDCDLWTKLPGEIEYQKAKQLLIFPNPAVNEITIRLPVATADESQWGPMTSRQYNYRYHENSVLKIFDIYGRLIEEISLRDIAGNELQKNVSGYKSGIYLVNLFENQKLMASGKFVKE